MSSNHLHESWKKGQAIGISSNVPERIANIAGYSDERRHPRFTDIINRNNNNNDNNITNNNNNNNISSKRNKSYDDDQVCDSLAFLSNLLQRLIQR